MTNYGFIHAELRYIAGLVNDAIKKGLQPIGGIAYLEPMFVQAMVKYSTPSTNAQPDTSE